jgi:hypothetical protein
LNLSVVESQEVQLPAISRCDGAIPSDFPAMYLFNGNDRGHRQYVKGRWQGLPGRTYDNGFLDDKWEVACISCDTKTVVDLVHLVAAFKRGEFMGKLIP